MIDYFALLDQPRAPWLDPAGLKDAYHRKTLQAHPDTAAIGDRAGDFAELNEAYQILQDPKRRLHHLLELEGQAPVSTNQTIPEGLHDLFPAISTLTQRANLLQEKIKTATSALSRSLQKPEIMQMQKETKAIREKLQAVSEASLARLRVINGRWIEQPTTADDIADVVKLYFVFAYLTRWSAELDELAFWLDAL